MGEKEDCPWLSARSVFWARLLHNDEMVGLNEVHSSWRAVDIWILSGPPSSLSAPVAVRLSRVTLGCLRHGTVLSVTRGSGHACELTQTQWTLRQEAGDY